MCGRYSITTPGEVLAEAFGLDDVPELAPRHNAAPTQALPVIRAAVARRGPLPQPDGGRRCLELLRFGWNPGGGPLLINARSETAAALPAFRAAFRARRCVVPADGFFEWRALPGVRKRQPYFLHARAGGPLALAGLWEETAGGGAFVILTTAPNAVVARIHDRMPALLPPAALEAWLDPRTPVERLEGVLRPAPDDALAAHPVSLLVNDVRNDVPEVSRALF
jgi:putative SOS response-associated peptidase YedK